MHDREQFIAALPERITTEEQLDEVMTRPTARLVEFIRTLGGRLLVLGAGGKMGPTLAVLARRAAEVAGVDLKIIAASRFSDSSTREWLEARGVETVRCDLLRKATMVALPDADNVIYMAGRKFETSGSPAMTWAMNTIAPIHVAERYPDARTVALSSGSVYPFVPVGNGGSKEGDELTPPGEYANACIARERLFEYYSAEQSTPVCLVRLNYATDLRYGVLVDIATSVYNGRPVSLANGYLNCIWQGDANEMIIRALQLAETPAVPLNLTCREILSVRDIAHQFGALFGKQPVFAEHESDMALLNDPARAYKLLGEPYVPVDRVIAWTADWVTNGGKLLGKPTGFEVQDGGY